MKTSKGDPLRLHGGQPEAPESGSTEPAPAALQDQGYIAVKQWMDFFAAWGFLALLSPVMMATALYLFVFKQGKVLLRVKKVGRGGALFNHYYFNLEHTVIRYLPHLFNIIKGDLALIGPLPRFPETQTAEERAALMWQKVRPGFVSDWWIRQRANVDFEEPFEVDQRYAERLSFKTDLGIALRAVPAIIKRLINGPKYMERGSIQEHIRLLGIPIDNVSMTAAIERIVQFGHDAAATRQICFVNADCVNIAFRNPAYKAVIDQSDLVFADGIGVKIASKIFKLDIVQNVNGTDMFPRLCEALDAIDGKLFLLGARPGVAEDVKAWINQHTPRVQVVGARHGYFTKEEEPAVVETIRNSSAHVLLVAFGVPRQDCWIAEHRHELGVGAAMGVGGLFDFYSGRAARAPQWVREIGMEWFFRFCQEPGRLWRRYFIGNAVFLYRVFRNKPPR
ncbi:MAG: WecB/TagA/CpsF family glycosyltransferase [Candidatus Hydrogenedentes bacterium]|nr:WecB/TagA/CpsF family glycosyltransferase [Candidatus Hydrogenedentota bacterium]